MTTFKRNIRGLQDIQTHSGRSEEGFLPHKAYMRISCLEMEKARRGKERESAAHRIKNIDARFEDIEAEKAELLNQIEQMDLANSMGASTGEANGSSSGKKGIKIRY